MKRIPLTRDKFALVDDEDYPILIKYSWQATRMRRTCYAITSMWNKGNQKGVRMHRLILGLTVGNKLVTDHIDGNGLNNQKANLRIITNRQNGFNRKPNKNSTSKFKGVCRRAGSKKWGARIQKTHLGYFTNEIKAAKVYDLAAEDRFGELARLNFPKKDKEKHGDDENN